MCQPPFRLRGVRGSDVADGVGLLFDGLHHARMLVAEVHHLDLLGAEVKVALAVCVPEPGALAADDGKRGERPLNRPGEQGVLEVLVDDLLRCAYRLHAATSFRRALVSRTILALLTEPKLPEEEGELVRQLLILLAPARADSVT